jgi:hypothetical protein
MREFLVRVTEHEPNPPRAVGFGRVLGVVGRSSLGFAGFGFGALMIVGSLGFLLGSKGALAPQLIGWAFVFFGLVLIAIPFIYARRVAHALKTGVLSMATVVSLDTSLGPGRKTLDSMKNGFVAGIRRVQHPQGEFEEHFQYDGPGAANLHPGSSMSVLVGPDKTKVLLDVPNGVVSSRGGEPLGP